jgi:hypothetical protein
MSILAGGLACHHMQQLMLILYVFSNLGLVPKIIEYGYDLYIMRRVVLVAWTTER